MQPVVHVITTLNRGGAENQLFTLAKEQVKVGRTVKVMALKGENELEEDFMRCGVVVDNNLLNRNVLFQIYYLSRIAKHNRGIFHAHLPRAELLVALSAVSKNRFVASRHNAEPFFPKAPRFISIFLSRVVNRRAREIVAISVAVKDYLFGSLEIPKKRNVKVVHYGVNSELVINRKEFRTGTPPTFGTIARLVPQKDIPTLLRAFSIFLQDDSFSKLVVVGEGYLSFELMSLCKELKIVENVIWAGKTDNVPSVLNRMDLFILASNYEGFGLVLLEAMQNGVPVIAANNSAIPEVLGSANGNLFKTGDADQLAKLMREFTVETNWAKLQNEGFKRLKLFDVESMRLKIDQVYG